MTTLTHSKTTQNLISQLSRLKSQKNSIANKIKQSISRTTEMLEQRASLTGKYNQKRTVDRERSIQALEHRLNHKLKSDRQSDFRLGIAAVQTDRRRSELERRIQQITQRNARRLSQLQQVQSGVVRKIVEEVKRNEARERTLREEYERLKRDQQKVFETRVQQGREAGQQWRVLRGEKWRLQEFVREGEQRQQRLVFERNPAPVKREQKKKGEDRILPNEKEYNKLKPLNVNSKEMGNQYLQQVRMIHREQMVSRKKKKLMNLNLKVINYHPEVMERILRSTGDLSKRAAPNPEHNQVEKEDVKSERAERVQKIEKIEREPVRSQFLMGEDLETQRYLKKIKLNLQELERINKQNEEHQNQNVQLESVNSHGEQMLIPSTLQIL